LTDTVYRPEVAAGVHGQGAAVTEVDEVSTVAQAIVDHGSDPGDCHVVSVPGAPGLRGLSRT